MDKDALASVLADDVPLDVTLPRRKRAALRAWCDEHSIEVEDRKAKET